MTYRQSFTEHWYKIRIWGIGDYIIHSYREFCCYEIHSTLTVASINYITRINLYPAFFISSAIKPPPQQGSRTGEVNCSHRNKSLDTEGSVA